MTKTSLRRGDVVLVSFPFADDARTKRRPALVVQADRYNRGRAMVVLASITSSRTHRALPCKVYVKQDSKAGRASGLRFDSVVDCQTLVTLPREDIAAQIGALPASAMQHVDDALRDALGLDK
jgi:mRNA interferase MazF